MIPILRMKYTDERAADPHPPFAIAPAIGPPHCAGIKSTIRFLLSQKLRGNLRRVPIDRGRGVEELRQVQGRHVYIRPQNTPDRGAQMPGVGGVHHQRNLWDL